MFKKKKGMLAGLFTALMAFAIATVATPAFATGETLPQGTIKVNGLEQKATSVSAYKVVNETLQPDGTIKFEWADGITDVGTIEDYFNVESDGLTFKSNSAMQKLAATLAGKVGTAVATQDAKGKESVAFEGLDAGEYLVLAKGKDATTIFQNMIVDVTPKVENNQFVAKEAAVTAKKTTHTVDKKADGKDAIDDKGLGQVIDFTITTQVPDYPTNAINKKFEIRDTMSKGLSYKGELSITVNGVEHTDWFNITQPEVDAKGKGDAADITITFKDYNDDVAALANKDIVVTYKAAVNDEAVFTKLENNNVQVDVATNPNVKDDYKTEEDNVTVKTLALKVIKHEAEKEAVLLPDAEFDVYLGEVKEENKIGHLKTDGKGEAVMNGLAKGQTYNLVETKAPAGYQLLTTPISVTMSAEQETTTVETIEQVKKIENAKQGELPETGGPGTVALTAAGVVLMAGAGAYVVRSKKNQD